jgi:maltose alpha-D-glucosyltransferase/alpha-amylase
MLRSFHYASVSALIEGVFRPEDIPLIVPWARLWNVWVGVGFLQAYLDVAREAEFLPEARDDLRLLLDLYLLDKALYELEYELNNRPDWVRIPLRGIDRLLEVRRGA